MHIPPTKQQLDYLHKSLGVGTTCPGPASAPASPPAASAPPAYTPAAYTPPPPPRPARPPAKPSVEAWVLEVVMRILVVCAASAGYWLLGNPWAIDDPQAAFAQGRIFPLTHEQVLVLPAYIGVLVAALGFAAAPVIWVREAMQRMYFSPSDGKVRRWLIQPWVKGLCVFWWLTSHIADKDVRAGLDIAWAIYFSCCVLVIVLAVGYAAFLVAIMVLFLGLIVAAMSS